jgi:hypothetical protein
MTIDASYLGMNPRGRLCMQLRNSNSCTCPPHKTCTTSQTSTRFEMCLSTRPSANGMLQKTETLKTRISNKKQAYTEDTRHEKAIKHQEQFD